ncbi:Gustatory receptor 114d [Halyomorpha halys]|nr:Gustatory receptor 114d [Halyomorpha halys]
MVGVTPCQPTIGVVRMVLNDVFKLSRVIGTFPIDSEYSRICKKNLARRIFLYILPSAIAMMFFHQIIVDEYEIFSAKIWKIIYSISSAIFYWIDLVWLIRNRILLKEFYYELKDIEYNLWKNGVFWSYKPSWSTKYLCMIGMFLCVLFWITKYYQKIIYIIATYIMVNALINIMCQYTILLQVLLSVLREIKSIEDSRTVVKLTDKLLALCQNVNALYEPQLFWYILAIFMFNLFFIYVSILRKAHFTPIYVIWLMFFIFPLVQTVNSVANFSQEVKITNKMLYRRLLKNLEDETLQFHLLAKRDLVFTAAGFFILENTLICTMVTTGIDYLIFFLQYM